MCESGDGFFIRHRFPTLNELIAAAKSHPGKYSQLKKRLQDLVGYVVAVEHVRAYKRVRIRYEFRERDRRRDPSNVAAAAIKIIEDALVQSCVLPDDGWGQILGYSVEWCLTQGVPGVYVTIEGDLHDRKRTDLHREKRLKEAQACLGKSLAARAGAERPKLGAAPSRKAPVGGVQKTRRKLSAGNGARRRKG
jgi:hypothetical protein